MSDSNTPAPHGENEGVPSAPPPPPPAYGEQSGAGERPTPPGQQAPGQQPAYGQPNAYGQQPAYGYAPAAPPSKVLGILSMVGGIVGVVTVLFYIGILFGIAGVVLGFIARSKEPQSRGFWLTGLITGFAAIVLSIGYYVLIGVLFATFGASYSRYGS